MLSMPDRSPRSPRSPGQVSPQPCRTLPADPILTPQQDPLAALSPSPSPSPVTSPLVLCQPPRGRTNRSSVSSLGATLQPPSPRPVDRGRHSVSLGEDLGERGFDTELQRALELSQLSLNGERPLHAHVHIPAELI